MMRTAASDPDPLLCLVVLVWAPSLQQLSAQAEREGARLGMYRLWGGPTDFWQIFLVSGERIVSYSVARMPHEKTHTMSLGIQTARSSSIEVETIKVEGCHDEICTSVNSRSSVCRPPAGAQRGTVAPLATAWRRRATQRP